MPIPNPSNFVPTEEAVYFPLTMTNFIFLANFHFHANQVPIRLSVHSLPDSTSAIYTNSAVYSATWHFQSPEGASALYITSTVCQALLQTPSSVLGKPAVPKLDEFRRFSGTTKFIVDFLTHWGLYLTKIKYTKIKYKPFPPPKNPKQGREWAVKGRSKIHLIWGQ